MLFLEYPNKKVKTLLPEGLKLSSGEKICVNNMNTIYSMIVKDDSTFSIHYNIFKQSKFRKI